MSRGCLPIRPKWPDVSGRQDRHLRTSDGHVSAVPPGRRTASVRSRIRHCGNYPKGRPRSHETTVVGAATGTGDSNGNTERETPTETLPAVSRQNKNSTDDIRRNWVDICFLHPSDSNEHDTCHQPTRRPDNSPLRSRVLELLADHRIGKFHGCAVSRRQYLGRLAIPRRSECLGRTHAALRVVAPLETNDSMLVVCATKANLLHFSRNRRCIRILTISYCRRRRQW